MSLGTAHGVADSSLEECASQRRSLSGQPSTFRLLESAQAGLLAAMQAMQATVERQEPQIKPPWHKQLKAVQAALRFVYTAAGHDVALPGETAVDAEKLSQFAQTLRERRRAIKLTQEQLADRAGLSRGTIRGLEKTRHVPSTSTLMRLLAVRELKLDLEALPLATRADVSVIPNCWIAPGYDPLKLFAELLDQVNGSGGSLEQTYAYLDHQSASKWHALITQSRYASMFRANMPLDAAAKQVLQSTQGAGLDVIALGSGDGKQEVRLVQLLLAHSARGERESTPDLRLYLLDISQPLLGAAYKHAANTLGDKRGVFICAVQGNFHHLPRYTQLHYTPERSHRRRLICMLGLTVGNLDNEVTFFRHSLSCFAKDDLLLLDIQKTYAAVDDPDVIRQADPALASGVPKEHADFLSGPFASYCKDFVSVAFRFDLQTSCPVPGSYALEAVATVRLAGRRQKEFSAFRFKRYDVERLAGCLGSLGWELQADLPYGAAGEAPVHSLLLFKKR